MPLSILSKKVGMSQQLLNYHLNKLQQEEIIKGFRVILEIGKLGYFGYRVYFQLQRASIETEKKIITYFQLHPHVLWFVSTQGRWDLEVLIMTRNHIHFDAIFKEIMAKWGTHLANYSISISVVNYHLSRAYFLNKKRDYVLPPFIGSEPIKENLDEYDYKIITTLSKNARLPFFQMEDLIHLSYNTIKERVKKMEKKGIIQGYRTWINTFKLGYKYYKVMISTHSFNQEFEKEIYNFCLNEPNTIYFIRCIGEWNFEIDGEFKDDEEFRTMLRRLRNTFTTKIKTSETLLIYAEHKMNYYPMGTL